MIRATKKQLVQLYRLGPTRETHPRCSIRKEGRKGTAPRSAQQEAAAANHAQGACKMEMAASSPEGQQPGTNGGHGRRKGSSSLLMCRKHPRDTEAGSLRTVPEAAPVPSADGAEALPTTVPDCFAPLRLRHIYIIGEADAKGQSRRDTGEDRARTPPQKEQEQLEDTAAVIPLECPGMLEDTSGGCCFPSFWSAGVCSWLLPKGELAAISILQAVDKVVVGGGCFLLCPSIEAVPCPGGLFPSFLPSFYGCLVNCVMVVCCPALVKLHHRRCLALCSAAKSIGRNCSPSHLQRSLSGCNMVYIYCLSGRFGWAVNRYQLAGTSSGSKITTCSPGL